jgi:sugar O-acyltransferase (sialic acid O-acetyltransferase NeuD family)
MPIKKLTILGKSDAVITMILDNLESNELFVDVEIINNLRAPISHTIENPKFKISIKEHNDGGDAFILGVNKSANKVLVTNFFNYPFDRYINLFHKSSQISSTTTFGRGCMINSLVSIGAHTTIGNFVSMNRNASIGHHTILNDFVTIHPGANVAGFATIGEKTMIGMGSNIIDGIRIGKNSIIGAGSVVTKDIPDNVIAYGNPCRIIRANETLS